MRATNTLETYGLVHQLLHWTTALLILVLIPLGVYMHELPEANPQDIADKVWLYSLHKTIGIAALAVALMRIGWALIQPHPRGLHGGVEGYAAATVHWLLYGSIVAMPVFGWLHHASAEGFAPIWWTYPQTLPFVPKDVAVSQFFATAHLITGFVLVGSLALHIAGALKHVVIDKDLTLARMVPGAYDETGAIPDKKSKGAAPVATAVTVAILASVAAGGVFAWERGLLTAPTEIATAPASDGAWVIDQEASQLAITIQQLGSPVEGEFARWTADVVFDPAAPENAQIAATIDTTSLTLGDVTTRATSDEFLNATAEPTANFLSEDVTATPDGYEAAGTLTIAGTATPFTLPFTFAETDGRAIVDATATIPRLDFGVGKGFADDSSVGRDVGVTLHIEATRAADAPSG